MTVEISGNYIDNLKVELRHGPSGTVIHTAAPVDNNGDGSSFSPTDLVAAGVGACMLTIMAIVARRENIDFSGVTFTLEKHMTTAPRRIDSIPICFSMPRGLTDVQKKKLEHAALTCPVSQSLLPEIKKDVTFLYGDDEQQTLTSASSKAVS